MYTFLDETRPGYLCCTSLSVTCGAAVGWCEAGQAVWPVQRGGAVERRRTARSGGGQGGGGRGGRGQGAPVLLQDKKGHSCDMEDTKKLVKIPQTVLFSVTGNREEFSSPPQSCGSVTYSHPPWSLSLSSLPVSPCPVFPSLLSHLLETAWGDCDR